MTLINPRRTAVEPVIERELGLTLLALRLLVARAASADSLRWWDDEALTAPAAFVLARTFPHSPPLAARSLALQAALARHVDAAEYSPDALHLYRLDWYNGDVLALRDLPLLDAPLDPAPIPTLDEYRRRLLALTGAPTPYTIVRPVSNGGLVIQLPPTPRGVHPWRHRAAGFAWAYQEGEPDRAAIPIVIE